MLKGEQVAVQSLKLIVPPLPGELSHSQPTDQKSTYKMRKLTAYDPPRTAFQVLSEIRKTKRRKTQI
jgi:hypothetical protein